MLNTEHKLNKIDKYFITPNYTEKNSKEYFIKIEKLFISGIKLLQFRSKNLKLKDYAVISKKIYTLCKKYNVTYIINDYTNLKLNKYCDGIQLTSENLINIKINNIDKKYMLFGSCHNINEIKICNNYKLDFILISPIKNTGSKKGIGWSNFKRLVSVSNIPVFALGGMLYDEDINTVKCCGAIGVASTSNFYNLFNA